MKSSVKKSVPSAVQPAAGSFVAVNDSPNREPYEPMRGKAVNPSVPRTETEGETPAQPRFSGGGGTAADYEGGSKGSPSVPVSGFLFTRGPVDVHYTSTEQAYDPYGKVNNPPTRGMWTRIQMFLNGIATSQDTDNTGFRVRHGQQRTSVMRNALPPHGSGYAPESYTPRQMPQHSMSNITGPRPIGTDRYGTGVLNTDTLGAGQTSGGVGGNVYTPAPPPPAVNSIAVPANTSGMPVWG